MIRVGVWAHSHAEATIRTHRVPILEALHLIQLPAQRAIVLLAVAEGDCPAWAIMSAFRTDPAEINERVIAPRFVYQQGQVGGNHAKTYTRTLPGRHQNAYTSYLAQTSLASDQRCNKAVVAVDVGASGITEPAA